jgi:hypothetical protein
VGNRYIEATSGGSDSGRLLRCFGRHEPEPIRDAMNVGVDADGGNVETEAEDQVGRFAPDAG